MIINPAIVPARLGNQHLVENEFRTCAEAVAWFGAVQGQDFYAAKWALGLRVKNTNDPSIEKAFNEGEFLRVHAMRPTWHLVAPVDIRWLQMLTGPRVHAANAYYYRKLELDGETFKRSNAVLAKALGGNKHLTRTELKQALEAGGIDVKGLRLAYIIMYAELEGLICNGPIRGKQHTYALIEERVPKTKALTRDEALAELTKRYFTSHGPALPQDFAWWSGLTLADVKRGLDMNKNQLQTEEIGGKTLWFAEKPKPLIKSPFVRLLPNYDEYLIAYKDRHAFFDSALITTPSDIEDVLMNHLLVVDGQVVGGWRRVLAKNAVNIQVKLLRLLSKKEKAVLKIEADRYGEFLGINANVEYLQRKTA